MCCIVVGGVVYNVGVVLFIFIGALMVYADDFIPVRVVEIDSHSFLIHALIWFFNLYTSSVVRVLLGYTKSGCSVH